MNDFGVTWGLFEESPLIFWLRAPGFAVLGGTIQAVTIAIMYAMRIIFYYVIVSYRMVLEAWNVIVTLHSGRVLGDHF